MDAPQPYYFGVGLGSPDGLPALPSLPVVQKSAPVGEQMMSRAQGGYGGFYGNFGAQGGRRTEQVRHFRLWNYIAISLVAFEAARYRPNVAFVKTQDPRQTQHKSWTRKRLDARLRQHRYEKSLHQIQPHEDVTPVGPDHPINRLFDRPNRWDKGGIHDVLEELIIFLRLTGVGYLFAPSDSSGKPQELWCMPSHWVHGPRLDPKNGIWYYMVIPVVLGGAAAGMWFIPADEMIHFAYKNPRFKLLGSSPIQAASEWTDIQDSLHYGQYATFKNVAVPLGTIELDKEMHDPDQGDLERIYAKLFSRMQGEGRFGRPLVLSPGMKWNPLTINVKELMFLDAADKVRDNILSLHGVPKELVGITDAGSEIAMYGPMKFFALRTLGTTHAFLSRVLTHDLARRYDDSIRIWWDDVSPDNPEQVSRDLAQDLGNGTITMDEYRVVRGREPYDISGWSDKPLVQPTLAPLGEGGDLGDPGDLFASPLTEEVAEGRDEETQAPGEPKPDEPGDTAEDDPPPAPRPEVTRALVAVNGSAEANGHAKCAPKPLPVAIPEPKPEHVAEKRPHGEAVISAPSESAKPKRRKSLSRRFLADLFAGWTPPVAPAIVPDSAGELRRAGEAIVAQVEAAVAQSATHKRIRLPDGREVQVKETPMGSTKTVVFPNGETMLIEETKG